VCGVLARRPVGAAASAARRTLRHSPVHSPLHPCSALVLQRGMTHLFADGASLLRAATHFKVGERARGHALQGRRESARPRTSR
jgi:hypothetical protein